MENENSTASDQRNQDSIVIEMSNGIDPHSNVSQQLDIEQNSEPDDDQHISQPVDANNSPDNMQQQEIRPQNMENLIDMEKLVKIHLLGKLDPVYLNCPKCHKNTATKVKKKAESKIRSIT